MLKKPDGESSRTPTDFWSGLGFSKSMPDSEIRERLKHCYNGPSMTTTYEVRDSLNRAVVVIVPNIMYLWYDMLPFTTDIVRICDSRSIGTEQRSLLFRVLCISGNIFCLLVFYLLYLHLMFYCYIVYCIGVIIYIACIQLYTYLF